MKNKLIKILGILLWLAVPVTLFAAQPFNSAQLAPTPSNGNCLTTNGSINAWSSSCGSGGGGGSASTPFGGLQFSVPSGTSTAFSASSNMVYSTTTSILSILNSSTTNATSTNFYTSVLSLGASAISYIQGLFSATTPIVDTAGVISCNTASGSQAGCLASADWTTFNNKQPAGTYLTSATGVTTYNGSSGAVTGISVNTGDWAGTWQTHAPSYFQTALGFTPYNATNPSNYIPLTALSSSATGLTYTNTTGVFSLTSGYNIPLTASTTNWNGIYNSITNNTAGYVLQASSTATNNVAWVSTSTLGISGGGGSQTPWTSNIDGGGYALSNVSTINGTYLSLGQNSNAYNLAIGNHALGNASTTSSSNVAVGYNALFSNTTGISNTAQGRSTLYYNTTGFYNTSMGSTAGYTLASGNYNTFLGNGADVSAAASTTLSNSTAIGNGAIVTQSNEMVLGNTSVSQTLLKGNVGIGTTTPATALDVNGIITSETGGIQSQGIATSTFSGAISTGNVVIPSIVSAGCLATNSSGLIIASTTCSGGAGGGLTSVGLSAPTGLTVSNSPLTSNGTIGLALTAGYVIPLSASTTQWNNLYNASTTLGGAGGTWSTTTSTVSGELINYPNNSTDIVTIGGNSTSTAPFWFNPNASGSNGIIMSVNKTTPTFPQVSFGGTLWSGNSSNVNVTASGYINSDAGFISKYGGTIGFSDSSGWSNVLNTSNSFMNAGGTKALLTILQGGNVGIGTTTPATALDVNGGITDENVKSATCLATDSTGKIVSTTCGTGTGGLATSSPWTVGNLAYVSSSGTIGSVGTSTLSASSPLTGSFTQVGSGGTLGIQVANTSQSGYLTNTDWNTFNGKQAAGAYLTSVTADSPLGGSGTSGSHLTCATCNTSNATVSSVAITTPTGLSVSGSPITTSGTLGLTLTSGYNIPLTASTTQWASAYASTTALSGTSPIVYTGSTGVISCPTCQTGSPTNFFTNSGATTTLTTGSILTALTGTFGTINATSTTGTSTFSNAATFGGNVGIGTTSPGAILTVAGNTSVANILSVTGGTGISGVQGQNISLATGNGLGSISAFGGDFTVSTGAGVTGSGSGRGGNMAFTLGNGGSNSGPVTAGAGGSFSLIAGNGGNSSSVAPPGAGGAITFTSGNAGTVSSGNGANGGNIIFMPGTGSGTGVSGNVGIGTTTPLYGLTIATDTDIDNGLFHASTTASVITINTLQEGAPVFQTDSGVVTALDEPVDTSATVGTLESYSFNSGGTPVMTVYGLSSGAGATTNLGVGIGTTTPASPLDVNGNVTIEKANGIIMRDTVTGSCYIIKVTSGVLVPTASTTAAC